MKRRCVRVTTGDPLPRGARVAIDSENVLWVTATTGTGPYTSTLRHHPTLPIRALHAWQRITRPVHDWWEDRCRPYDDRNTVCWRTATYNGRCDRHVLAAVERGDEL